jgi:hypothetical protein
VLSPNQVPAQIEQIANLSVSAQESLSLLHRLKSPHPSLPHPRRIGQQPAVDNAAYH